MGNPLILVGILLIAAGIAANMRPDIHWPLLPGDILIQKEGFTIYIPIVSSILISFVLMFVLWLLRR